MRLHAKMEMLMVLPGSFHYAGYAGELNIRTERDEEINGTARRCFLGDASISFEDFE